MEGIDDHRHAQGGRGGQDLPDRPDPLVILQRQVAEKGGLIREDRKSDISRIELSRICRPVMAPSGHHTWPAIKVPIGAPSMGAQLR
jgi:hypothetical protein